jgi:hypothetical protein
MRIFEVPAQSRNDQLQKTGGIWKYFKSGEPAIFLAGTHNY